MATLHLGENDGAPVLTIVNTEAGMNIILTAENIMKGGQAENPQVVEQQASELINQFLYGDTNE